MVFLNGDGVIIYIDGERFGKMPNVCMVLREGGDKCHVVKILKD